MKKMLASILIVMLIVCTSTAAMAYTTMYVYTANGKSLNLRDAPSLTGNVITRIPNGSSVRVNDMFSETWYSVSYGGYVGYVMASYLVYYSSYTPTATPQPVVTSIPYYYYVTPTPTASGCTFPNEIFSGFTTAVYQAVVQPSNPAGYVNLRWAPSLEADIHAFYYANSILTVMSQNGEWCQVLDEANNVMGFMMREFLSPYNGNS